MKNLFLSLAFLTTLNATAQTRPEPLSEAKPAARWWWLGSAVDKEGLTYNLEEFAKAGLEGKVWQYFTIVPDFRTTGITENGERSYDWPVVIRAINSVDATAATPEPLDWALLNKLNERITKEVKGVNRTLIDITTKPSGTIEWE